jgi:transcriptional regulator with XRE-family HTH domain
MGSKEADIAARQAFAARLKAEMRRRGFSYRMLAEAIDASKQSVTNWTQGTHEPRLRHIRRLSETLQVPIAELLGDELRFDVGDEEAAAIVDGLAELRLSSSVDSLRKATPTLLDLLARAERQARQRRTGGSIQD